MDEVLTDDALNAMNGLGDGVRDGVNALARRHGLPVQATGVGSIFGIHFHDGAIRNIADLDAGEHGREAKIAALKKLFHLDLFEAGIYISRRVMGNLSLATTPADTRRLLEAVDEFMASRGALVREAVTG
jgi:glutamate-1-semialdehyde 2,1-aminomutase